MEDPPERDNRRVRMLSIYHYSFIFNRVLFYCNIFVDHETRAVFVKRYRCSPIEIPNGKIK